MGQMKMKDKMNQRFFNIWKIWNTQFNSLHCHQQLGKQTKNEFISMIIVSLVEIHLSFKTNHLEILRDRYLKLSTF